VPDAIRAAPGDVHAAMRRQVIRARHLLAQDTVYMYVCSYARLGSRRAWLARIRGGLRKETARSLLTNQLHLLRPRAMASSFRSYRVYLGRGEMSRPIELERVNDALSSQPGPQNDRIIRVHRHNFWSMSDHNRQLFDRVRELIRDEDYWAKEDEHFRFINSLIVQHNIKIGTQGPRQYNILDSTCPALDTIRRLFHVGLEDREALSLTPSGINSLLT
jgi:hypothetical protein